MENLVEALEKPAFLKALKEAKKKAEDEYCETLFQKSLDKIKR